ncbi:MAG: macro domain-containing protein [Sphingobacteriia bacterium]|jgi:O-acetyl-ADP-ribose deacetylase (regulator of RNase III)/uncharacterized protein YwgA
MAIRFTQGNLLQSEAEALVNTVNTVGVMGKGIALQFKEAFPANFKAYREASKHNELAPGKLLVLRDKNLQYGEKIIINFPTKTHWKGASKYEYIESGLVALRKLLLKGEIQSIAIPPLGCGQGGLDWARVKLMILEHLQGLETVIDVYEPNSEIKATLQAQPMHKKPVKLTRARAMLLYALFHYEQLGEQSSPFSANKLAYFLQRLGEPMKLEFKPYIYGPYDEKVTHVLYALNGQYLKGLEQKQAKSFEPLLLDYSKWKEVSTYVAEQLNEAEQDRLQRLIQLLTGFESELSLELLATVDFILARNPEYNQKQVMEAIRRWNRRKERLFKEEYVQIAYNHWVEHQALFSN